MGRGQPLGLPLPVGGGVDSGFRRNDGWEDDGYAGMTVGLEWRALGYYSGMGGMMKISGFSTRVMRVPAENPLVEGVPIGPGTRDFVTLELNTDEGIQGIGYSFMPGMVGNPLFTALKVTVDVMCEMIVGDDPIPGGGHR